MLKHPLTPPETMFTKEIVKRLRKSDCIIGAITLGLVIFLYVNTVVSFPEDPHIVSGAPTESFFPRIMLGLLGAFSIALITLGIRAKPEMLKAIKWAGIVKVVAGMVLIAIYVTVVEDLELFFVLTPLLIVSLMAITGERDWKMLVAVPLLYVLLAYFVFFKLFGVMFPTKIFM